MLQIVCQISCVHINMSLSLCDDSHHYNLSFICFKGVCNNAINIMCMKIGNKNIIYLLIKLTGEFI